MNRFIVLIKTWRRQQDFHSVVAVLWSALVSALRSAHCNLLLFGHRANEANTVKGTVELSNHEGLRGDDNPRHASVLASGCIQRGKHGRWSEIRTVKADGDISFLVFWRLFINRSVRIAVKCLPNDGSGIRKEH